MGREKAMTFLLALFGCPHGDYSFPVRLPDEDIPHVTCRECCQRVPYSWDEMRIVGKPERTTRGETAMEEA